MYLFLPPLARSGGTSHLEIKEMHFASSLMLAATDKPDVPAEVPSQISSGSFFEAG